MKYTKGKEHSSGKTKINYLAREDSEVFIQRAKDDITAKDDPKLTKILPGKGEWATATTSAVFELFAAAGLPVSFLGRVSKKEFAARKAIMLPLEVLVRREVPKGSSFLKRNPQLTREDDKPHRFSKMLVEFCLKTTGGGYAAQDGQVIVNGLDALKGEEDPIIKNPYGFRWELMHSKKPWWEKEALLRTLEGMQVYATLREVLIAKEYSVAKLIEEIDDLTRKGFLVLEGAFRKLGGTLQDIKFEFGICLINGKWTIVFADVIDCDSWRLLINEQQYSKQVFRDKGEAGLKESAEKYAYIANLVQQFGIPRQVLVIWRGSTSDPMPDLKLLTEKLPMLKIIEVVDSGHKGTIRSLRKAQKIMADYPQGGIFVCLVGRSNGLGPILAAHVEWPVLSCPATYKDFPEDIHSSVRMPRETPNLTVWPDENIIPAVLGFLSASNPAVYALRRQQLEELDDPA